MKLPSQSETPPIRICRDCVHYRRVARFFFHPVCLRFTKTKTDPVSGGEKTIWSFCENQRSPEFYTFGICGPDGKFFIAKS